VCPCDCRRIIVYSIYCSDSWAATHLHASLHVVEVGLSADLHRPLLGHSSPAARLRHTSAQPEPPPDKVLDPSAPLVVGGLRALASPPLVRPVLAAEHSRCAFRRRSSALLPTSGASRHAGHTRSKWHTRRRRVCRCVSLSSSSDVFRLVAAASLAGGRARPEAARARSDVDARALRQPITLLDGFKRVMLGGQPALHPHPHPPPASPHPRPRRLSPRLRSRASCTCANSSWWQAIRYFPINATLDAVRPLIQHGAEDKSEATAAGTAAAAAADLTAADAGALLAAATDVALAEEAAAVVLTGGVQGGGAVSPSAGAVRAQEASGG
jgi:hypothetical protein